MKEGRGLVTTFKTSCGMKTRIYGEFLKDAENVPSACHCKQFCIDEIDNGCVSWNYYVIPARRIRLLSWLLDSLLRGLLLLTILAISGRFLGNFHANPKSPSASILRPLGTSEFACGYFSV